MYRSMTFSFNLPMNRRTGSIWDIWHHVCVCAPICVQYVTCKSAEKSARNNSITHIIYGGGGRGRCRRTPEKRAEPMAPMASFLLKLHKSARIRCCVCLTGECSDRNAEKYVDNWDKSSEYLMYSSSDWWIPRIGNWRGEQSTANSSNLSGINCMEAQLEIESVFTKSENC